MSAALRDALTSEEEEGIFSLAESVTGTHQRGASRKGVLIHNVLARMSQQGHRDIQSYLRHAMQNATEKAALINALTIHTTSWFRERPHFDIIKEWIREKRARHGGAPLRCLSVGCSTGEEVYSFALVLEGLRRALPQFDYGVLGLDLDPVSVATARKAIYALSSFPKSDSGTASEYQCDLRPGHGRAEGLFTLSGDIRRRCRFEVCDLRDVGLKFKNEVFDLIVCRNVLIYFKPDDIRRIVGDFTRILHPHGLICLGHSEGHVGNEMQLSPRGHGLFGLNAASLARDSRDSKARTIEQVKLPAKASPVSPASVAKSATAAAAAAAATASDASDAPHLADVASGAVQKQSLRPADLVLLGASTGGTEALLELLRGAPRPCPPILVVQHISAHFAKGFAQRLAQSSGLTLREAKQGEPLLPDSLYMSCEHRHLAVLKRPDGRVAVRLAGSAPRNGFCPSVDVLFESAAELPECRGIFAALLTGMGRDGAQGLKRLHEGGAMTFAQDEASSAVFGMPREAIRLGGAGFVGSIEDIRAQMHRAIRMRPPAAEKK